MFGKWRDWAAPAFGCVAASAFLLMIYTQVIQTRFESVIFSVVALVYLGQVAQHDGLLVELLYGRDRRNEVYRSLSARLGAPLDPAAEKAIDELKGQTEKMAAWCRMDVLARLPVRLIILWNLCRAVFFWPGP